MVEKTNKSRVILGIDPGTNIMGFGIIRINSRKPEYLDMGILDFRKEGDHYKKLKAIYSGVYRIIENYRPDEVAVEAPFFGKNVQSMLKLGRAQGVALAAALQHDLPVFEYAPRKIKLAITGVGQASKEQVAVMLQKILSIPDKTVHFDATDGLAAAICHYYEGESLRTLPSGPKNWADFIKKNPGRIK